MHRGQARGRGLVVAPKDVYAVKLINKLKGPVNTTVTYSKGVTNELMVEKKQIQPGASYTAGPHDYEEVRVCQLLNCGPVCVCARLRDRKMALVRIAYNG